MKADDHLEYLQKSHFKEFIKGKKKKKVKQNKPNEQTKTIFNSLTAIYCQFTAEN